ncbi:MAG: hypothetical protein RIS36_1534 [Pseudomonadota bacterium]|jgi:hypothetical protein
MDVIGVFVRYEDRRYRGRIDTVISETLLGPFAGESAVDEDPLPGRFDEGTICFTA